jgi:beta-glucanase (GH16 family)
MLRNFLQPPEEVSMRSLILIPTLLCSLGFSIAAAVSATNIVTVGDPLLALAPAVPTGYTLKWSDEFNGTGVDWSTWSFQHPDDPGETLPAAYEVSNGTLKLRTYTDTSGSGTDQYGYIGTSLNPTTGGGYQQTYGYFVARIKLQDKSGAYSAFWMQSPSLYLPGAATVPPAPLVGNPATEGTEMDIFEHREYDGNSNYVGNQIPTNVHWYTPDHYESLYTATNITIDDGNFHLYAMLWTPTSYRFYVDNQLYYTFQRHGAISQSPEYFVLNTMPTAADWGGPRPVRGYGPLGSDSNGVMTVDYIRAYALPEPGIFVMLALGLTGALAYAWRKRK